MSIKIEQAAAKMAEECQGKDHLVPIEEYLTSICNDRVAEKILKEDKTLQGSFKSMTAEAIKRVKTRTGTQCVALPDEEGYEIVREYFGITDDDLSARQMPAGDVIDITNLL